VRADGGGKTPAEFIRECSEQDRLWIAEMIGYDPVVGYKDESEDDELSYRDLDVKHR